MALTLGQKAGWGLADMGVVVFVVVKQLLVFAYLTSYLGVPVDVAGAATSAVLIFDIITDPLVGYFSDRINTRWGRRFPWMFIGALILAGAMVLMFSASPEAGVAANVTWVLGAFGLATIGFTFVAVPYSAMAGEMTQDPVERSAMTAWRMGFASIGILIGGGLIPVLRGMFGYSTAALIVAPLIVGAIWLSIFATRRAPQIEGAASISARRAWQLVSGNRAFMILMVLYGVMTFAVALITAGLEFASVYLIVDAGGSVLSGAAAGLGVLSFLFACFVLGALLSQVLWFALSARLGKVGALALGLLLYTCVLVMLFRALPAVDITVMAGLFVLAGVANGAYQQIPFAMYPDLMDVTRAESGESIEGAFSSVWLFGQKVGNALAPLVLGQFLALYGWQEAVDGVAVAQSENALGALQVGITVIPAVLLMVSVIGLMLVYRPVLLRTAGQVHRAV